MARKTNNKAMSYYSLHKAARDTEYPNKELYKRVVEKVFEVASKRLIDKHKVKLYGIGVFKIMSYKSDKKIVDFGSTKKLGKTVYYTNFHSNRVRYKIIWGGHLRSLYYNFKPYRFLNRELAKKIINDE